jgi:hypothetical protein
MMNFDYRRALGEVQGTAQTSLRHDGHETRFWIAQEVSHVKENAYANRLFVHANRVAGKKPKTLITGALGSYKMAAEFEFPHATRIREIALEGKVHNNKTERINGEIRKREKVMRGLKKTDTPILKGYQIFHNYIRPHEGLGGTDASGTGWNQGQGFRQMENADSECLTERLMNRLVVGSS